jgi:cell wall-associated NlpC family hydrolase
VAAPAAAAPAGDAIAADAERYQGEGYVYGGTGAHDGDWDCSSFVFDVLSRDLGMRVAGGMYGEHGFPPFDHGPDVLAIAAWAKPVRVPARGDLACWLGSGAGGHIGIVTGPDEMVSALDTQQGTLKTPIQGYGPAGAQLVYRRVTATPGAAVGPGGGGGGGGRYGGGPGLLLLAVGPLVLAAAAVGVGLVVAVMAGFVTRAGQPGGE